MGESRNSPDGTTEQLLRLLSPLAEGGYVVVVSNDSGGCLFEIYAAVGADRKNVTLVATATDGGTARDKMEEYARAKPGRYFIFSTQSHSIVTEMETFEEPAPKLPQGPAA